MALAEIKSFDSASLTWMGWNAVSMGELLDTQPELENLGSAICHVLVERLLSDPDVSFEFLLYRHAEMEDRYCYVGTWTEPSRPVCPAVSVNPFSSPMVGVYADHDELGSVGDHPEEIFIPFESHEGVLGFGIFRVLDDSKLADLADEDVFFLGRIVGQAFEQLLHCDRLEIAHQSMQTSVRYLESVLALSEDAIFLLDEEGRIVVANDRVEDYFGQLPLDVIGELVQDVLPPEGTVALLSGAHLSELRNEPVTRTLRRRGLKKASTGEIEAVFQAVHHEHGASGVLVRLRDLGRREDNSWFEDSLRSPDAGVGSLTRPLTAVRGFLGLLRDEVHPQGSALDLFQAMDVQLEWMQGQMHARVLTEEFRTGQVRWRDRPVEPLQLLTRAMDRLRIRFLARGIHLRLDVADDLPGLRLDVDKWCVALGCILERAVLHPDTARVTLAVSPEVDDNSRLTLRFSSDLSGEEPSHRVLSSVDAGTEEFTHAIPLVRSVVHQYGGVLEIDWDAKNVFTAEIKIPVAANNSLPGGAEGLTQI